MFPEQSTGGKTQSGISHDLYLKTFTTFSHSISSTFPVGSTSLLWSVLGARLLITKAFLTPLSGGEGAGETSPLSLHKSPPGLPKDTVEPGDPAPPWPCPPVEGRYPRSCSLGSVPLVLKDCDRLSP